MKMISLFCIIVIIAINAESSRLLLVDNCGTTGCGINPCFQCNPNSGKCSYNCCEINYGCNGNKMCINTQCSNHIYILNPDYCPQPKCMDACTDYSTTPQTPRCNGNGQTCVTVLETDPQTGCPMCDAFVGCVVRCGFSACYNGEVCCNPLHGICAPPGIPCIMG